MKKVFLGLVVGLLTVGTMAQADFRPGRVRAVAKSQMDQVNEEGRLTKKDAAVLFINAMDGKRDYVSFDVDQSIQVKCITAPCHPIHISTHYVVKKVKHGHGQTFYTAIEQPQHVRTDFPQSHRKLEVTFFEKEGEVAVTQETGDEEPNYFEGEIEYLAVTL